MQIITERKIDELGRVVIPRALRERNHLSAGDSIRIVEENGGLFLMPCGTRCPLCNAPISEESLYVLCDACLRDCALPRPRARVLRLPDSLRREAGA